MTTTPDLDALLERIDWSNIPLHEGTRSCYVKKKCREPQCVEANSEYMAKYRKTWRK